MGNGLYFECKKCRNKYSVLLGVGMIYPTVYKKFTERITAGEYGEDLKKAFTETKYAVVNAENMVFICDKCHNWEPGQNPSVYAPNDPIGFAKRRYGDETVEEWGGLPYATESDIDKDFHLLKLYQPKCKRCGGLMHKAKWEELETLPCSKCGGPGERENYWLQWD